MEAMDTDITLVGGDSKLEDLLKATGARIETTTADKLAVLTTAMMPRPDVLVVDARQQAFPPATLANFKRHHPSTMVLMVVPRFEATQLVEAMRAGVTECLADPVTQADLEAAIARALGRPATQAPGKIFVFVGAKGGVGTTTTAVNVAAALAQISPEHVLLIDLHLGPGDAAILLGVEPRFSILDALENIHRLDETLLGNLVAKADGVDLLASADRVIPASIGVELIRALLAFAAQAYPFTVVDTSPSDGTVLDALDSATRIVVLTNQELATVRGSSRIVRMLQQRYGKDRVIVAITREDKDAEIPRADIEQAIGGPIAYVLPSDYRAAVAALNRGRPIVSDGRSRLADSLKNLAVDLAGRKGEPSTQVPSTRRLGRTA